MQPSQGLPFATILSVKVSHDCILAFRLWHGGFSFFFLCGIFPKVLTDRTIFTVFPLTISFGSQKEGKEISVHLYVYVWLSGNFDWTNDAVFTLSDSTQTDKEENKLFFSSSSTTFSLIGWNVTERKSLVLWVIFTSFSCIHYMARGGTPLKSVVMA